MHQALAFWALRECVGAVSQWIRSEGIQMDTSMASANFSVRGGRVIRGRIGSLLESGFHHVDSFLKKCRGEVSLSLQDGSLSIAITSPGCN